MLPNKVKLINYTWKINKVPQASIDQDMIDRGPPGNFGGYCDRLTKEIYLSKELNDQDRPRVLLHELLHACFTNKFDILSMEKEEEVVRLFEERLTDLIKNNPKLITYLQENL